MYSCRQVMLGKRHLLLVVLHAHLAVAPAQGWQRTSSPPMAVTRCDTLDEAGGGVLEAGGDVVRRRRRGVVTTLENTGVDRPIGIWKLVPSPSGVTFVAAANGVFATHPDVDTLDQVQFGDPTPIGAVLDMVSDRVDRLWLLTATQLLVVDTGLWFGCVHSADDGLPPPPFHALQQAADGTLLLGAASGVFGYRPDADGPRLLQAEAIGLVEASGALQLRLAGEGAGTVTYRYRFASHHLLRPIDQGRIVLDHPGRHALLVYAIDRNLRRSAPLPLEVDVPLASTAWESFAIGGLLLVVAGLSGLTFWRARARGNAPARSALAAGLMAVIALQIVAGALGIGRTYPFIAFSMYREVYRQSDVLFKPAIVAGSTSGPREVSGGLLDFATDGVWRHLASLLHAGPAARDAFAAQFGADVDSLELRVRRCRLTTAGPREVAPWILARFGTGARARPESR